MSEEGSVLELVEVLKLRAAEVGRRIEGRTLYDQLRSSVE